MADSRIGPKEEMLKINNSLEPVDLLSKIDRLWELSAVKLDSLEKEENGSSVKRRFFVTKTGGLIGVGTGGEI